MRNDNKIQFFLAQYDRFVWTEIVSYLHAILNFKSTCNQAFCQTVRMKYYNGIFYWYVKGVHKYVGISVISSKGCKKRGNKVLCSNSSMESVLVIGPDTCTLPLTFDMILPAIGDHYEYKYIKPCRDRESEFQLPGVGLFLKRALNLAKLTKLLVYCWYNW